LRPPAKPWIEWLPVAVRVLVVGAQIATVITTWPLWQARAWPPLLPAVPLPQWDIGWLMIVSALAVLVHPRYGLTAHCVVVGLAMLMDQTRMQPEIVSHCLLMLGTLPATGAKLVGRMHLVSLWLFSGLHKLFSPAFFDNIAPALFGDLFPSAPAGSVLVFASCIVGAELALGCLALSVRTRRFAACAAVPFHLGVLASLVWIGWNQAVWPWNVALAGAGFGLLFPWRESLTESFARAGVALRAAAACVLLAPLLFYVGALDAYMAHCLYSGNTPVGIWVHDGQEENLSMLTMHSSLHVPLPPTHRTFWQFFLAAGHPGDHLVIEDSRHWAHWWRYARTEYEYPER
jgi:hypothetical protein